MGEKNLFQNVGNGVAWATSIPYIVFTGRVDPHSRGEEMRCEDSKTQFVTRKLYDELVSRCPVFMATVWVNLWKQFGIDGITVYQCAGSGLASRLNTIEGGK